MSPVRRTDTARLWMHGDQDQRVEQAGPVAFAQVPSQDLPEPGQRVKNPDRQRRRIFAERLSDEPNVAPEPGRATEPHQRRGQLSRTRSDGDLAREVEREPDPERLT